MMRLGFSKHVRRWAGAGALVLASSLGAAADVPVQYTDGGKALFRVMVPDFWEMRAGGSRMLTAPGDDAAREVPRLIGLSPEAYDDAWVGFIVPRNVRTIEQGKAYMREIGPHLVKNSEVSRSHNNPVAGLPAYTVAGTGKRGGKKVDFTAVLIKMPNGKVAFSVTVLEKGYDPSVLNDINGMYASFRAIR